MPPGGQGRTKDIATTLDKPPLAPAVASDLNGGGTGRSFVPSPCMWWRQAGQADAFSFEGCKGLARMKFPVICTSEEHHMPPNGAKAIVAISSLPRVPGSGIWQDHAVILMLNARSEANLEVVWGGSYAVQLQLNFNSGGGWRVQKSETRTAYPRVCRIMEGVKYIKARIKDKSLTVSMISLNLLDQCMQVPRPSPSIASSFPHNPPLVLLVFPPLSASLTRTCT